MTVLNRKLLKQDSSEKDKYEKEKSENTNPKKGNMFNRTNKKMKIQQKGKLKNNKCEKEYILIRTILNRKK